MQARLSRSNPPPIDPTKMPLSEVSNALFLTFLATEYLVLSNRSDPRQAENAIRQILNPRNLLAGLIVLIINFLERYAGLFRWINEAFHAFFYAPKILLAGIVYLVALYFDCKRVASQKKISIDVFLNRVGAAFCYVLPVYPFLAVLISGELSRGIFLVCTVVSYDPTFLDFLTQLRYGLFHEVGFFVLVTICDLIHVDPNFLQWPIYYGTLYGPFSVVYWKVKKNWVEDQFALPSSAGRRLGT